MSKKILAVFMAGLLFFGTGAAFFTYQNTDFGVADTGSWDTQEDSVSVISEIWVEYGGPIPLNLNWVEVGTVVKANGVELLASEKDGVELEEGNQTIEIEADLGVENIDDWWISHMRSGEVSEIEAIGSFGVDTRFLSHGCTDSFVEKEFETDIESQLNEALDDFEQVYEYDSGYPDEEAVEVRNIEIGIGEVDENRTEMEFKTEIRNMNDYPIPSPDFEGGLKLNGVEMTNWERDEVSYTETPQDGIIPPSSTGDISFMVELENSAVPKWFVSHVERDEFTEAEFELKMVFDFDNAGELTVPSDGNHCGFEFATDILVEQEPRSESTGCESHGTVEWTGDPPAEFLDDGDDLPDFGDDDEEPEDEDEGSDDNNDLGGLL